MNFLCAIILSISFCHSAASHDHFSTIPAGRIEVRCPKTNTIEARFSATAITTQTNTKTHTILSCAHEMQNRDATLFNLFFVDGRTGIAHKIIKSKPYKTYYSSASDTSKSNDIMLFYTETPVLDVPFIEMVQKTEEPVELFSKGYGVDVKWQDNKFPKVDYENEQGSYLQDTFHTNHGYTLYSDRVTSTEVLALYPTLPAEKIDKLIKKGYPEEQWWYPDQCILICFSDENKARSHHIIPGDSGSIWLSFVNGTYLAHGITHGVDYPNLKNNAAEMINNFAIGSKTFFTPEDQTHHAKYALTEIPFTQRRNKLTCLGPYIDWIMANIKTVE